MLRHKISVKLENLEEKDQKAPAALENPGEKRDHFHTTKTVGYTWLYSLHCIHFGPFFLRFCFFLKKYAFFHPHLCKSRSELR